MLKKTQCKYCSRLFQPTRQGHMYCSDTCRKLQHKAKNRTKIQAKSKRRLREKLIKLSSSAFGQYLIHEIRRAETVQILHGHTSISLKDLASLRRRCTAVSGYEDGKFLGTYELSHIYPVKDSKSIGLLSPKNLTIAPRAFNRKHASKKPIKGYLGESLARCNLDDSWRISNQAESLEILKLIRKYLGEEFDKWLQPHLINQTQRQALIKQLKQMGLLEKILKTMKLEQLKAIAKEEDISYFDISKAPIEPRLLLINELERLGVGYKLLGILELLEAEEMDVFTPAKYKFIGTQKDKEDFEKYIIEQSLACIHGQPYTTKYNNKEMLRYFQIRELKVFRSHSKASYNLDNGAIL